MVSFGSWYWGFKGANAGWKTAYIHFKTFSHIFCVDKREFLMWGIADEP